MKIIFFFLVFKINSLTLTYDFYHINFQNQFFPFEYPSYRDFSNKLTLNSSGYLIYPEFMNFRFFTSIQSIRRYSIESYSYRRFYFPFGFNINFIPGNHFPFGFGFSRTIDDLKGEYTFKNLRITETNFLYYQKIKNFKNLPHFHFSYNYIKRDYENKKIEKINLFQQRITYIKKKINVEENLRYDKRNINGAKYDFLYSYIKARLLNGRTSFNEFKVSYNKTFGFHQEQFYVISVLPDDKQFNFDISNTETKYTRFLKSNIYSYFPTGFGYFSFKAFYLRRGKPVFTNYGIQPSLGYNFSIKNINFSFIQNLTLSRIEEKERFYFGYYSKLGATYNYLSHNLKGALFFNLGQASPELYSEARGFGVDFAYSVSGKVYPLNRYTFKINTLYQINRFIITRVTKKREEQQGNINFILHDYFMEFFYNLNEVSYKDGLYITYTYRRLGLNFGPVLSFPIPLQLSLTYILEGNTSIPYPYSLNPLIVFIAQDLFHTKVLSTSLKTDLTYGSIIMRIEIDFMKYVKPAKPGFFGFKLFLTRRFQLI